MTTQMSTKLFHKNVFLASLLLLATAAFSFEGEVSFSSEEIRRHQESLNLVIEEAADCLQRDLDHHARFYQQYRISPFYGDRSEFAKMTPAQKRQVLRSLGLQPQLLSQLQPTSCVGITLKCLGSGFAKAGQQDLWAKARAFTVLNNVDGTALQFALQKLGWKVLYWNPDTRFNERWDFNEQSKDPQNTQRFWGYHSYRWATVRSRKLYMYNPVDDATSLVNFDRRVPQRFQAIPFWVGTAHTGYHVFAGTFGRVVEGHSTRAINDPQTVETSFFNPLEVGGGPRGQYFSGLMAVPPYYGY